MNLEALLPQLLALIPTLGPVMVALFRTFFNRRSRAMDELDRLLDMRAKCKNDSEEAESLDQAIEILAPRLSKRVRRRIEPVGVATFSIVGVVLLTVSYLVWYWAISSESFWVLVLATVVTFGSLMFMLSGIGILSKVDGEDSEGASKVAA